MDELLKKEREFVIPGEIIVKSMEWLPGKHTFRDGEFIISKRLGIVAVKNRVISVIPLNSVYIPKIGDMVIGCINEVQANGWIVDINSPYEAFLPLSGVRNYIDTSKTDLASIYDVGELIYAKIVRISRTSVYLSMTDKMARKIKSGRIVRMNPAKIPRLIGRQGSMIAIIKQATGGRIFVGQNGLIWFEGGDEALLIKAIEMIEREAYTEGLTDRVAKFLGVKSEAK
jgi:exosome complex component RRP4